MMQDLPSKLNTHLLKNRYLYGTQRIITELKKPNTGPYLEPAESSQQLNTLTKYSKTFLSTAHPTLTMAREGTPQNLVLRKWGAKQQVATKKMRKFLNF
jgi:hypothetical protein